MTNKIKTFTLGGLLALSSLWISSCKNNNTTNNDKTQQRTETPIEIEKTKTYNRVYDYMLENNGFYSYKAEFDSLRPSWRDYMDVDDIKADYTLGRTMTRQVISDGVKIIDKSYSEIVSLLAKHNIDLSNRISSKGDVFVILSDSGKVDRSCYKADMAFIGAGNITENTNKDWWTYREREGAFEKLTNVIFEVIDTSELLPETKNNIKHNVKNIFNKTKQNLQANRHLIEHKYKDYYLLDEYGKEMLGIGNYTFGYDNLDDESINGKYEITSRYTSVYNPFLSPELFADTTAKYKLVNIGKNRWRVEKHFGKDQVEVVKEFSGTATYSEHIGVTNNTVDFDDTNFEFESDTLFGGRIFFDEIIGVKERKKNWTVKIPKNAQHTIDSLNQEIIRKENLAKLIMDAQHEADSIAKSVVNEKFR